MKKNKITVFKTLESLDEKAANVIADLAEKCIKERGRFVLCVSGGTTPKKLYALLAAKPFSERVPWKSTFIFWSDERCVPLNDERNNAYMVSNILLKKVNIPAANIFPIPVQLPPSQAAEKYEATLREFFGKDEPHFDLIHLGLGENGHTASLFPDTPVLHEQVRWVKEVEVEDNVAGASHRITLTAPLINKARQILFIVSGEAKAAILETVLTGKYLPEKYPAQLIQPEHGEISWFIDSHAASNTILALSIKQDE